MLSARDISCKVPSQGTQLDPRADHDGDIVSQVHGAEQRAQDAAKVAQSEGQSLPAEHIRRPRGEPLQQDERAHEENGPQCEAKRKLAGHDQDHGEEHKRQQEEKRPDTNKRHEPTVPLCASQSILVPKDLLRVLGHQ